MQKHWRVLSPHFTILSVQMESFIKYCGGIQIVTCFRSELLKGPGQHFCQATIIPDIPQTNERMFISVQK